MVTSTPTASATPTATTTPSPTVGVIPPGLSSTRTITYTYDGLLRLTGADASVGTDYSYAYDLAGNRTGAWEDGVQVQSRSYNAANQVIGFSYDAAGNLLSDGTTTSAYDALNRQTSAGSTSYTYNGDGVLVQENSTAYTQDLASPLSQILHDGTTSYVYGHERLRAVNGPWYLADALGSVRATLNDTGAALATATYAPFGTVETSAIAPFGFTGERQVGDAVYLRARGMIPGKGDLPCGIRLKGGRNSPIASITSSMRTAAPSIGRIRVGVLPSFLQVLVLLLHLLCQETHLMVTFLPWAQNLLIRSRFEAKQFWLRPKIL
ncbi:hypothetical protein HC891_23920 [Candidatus Gracilibacteria bacterium]|nr:hypothetical protein [Candidatus Gracilibacteria bacterium]